MEAVKTKKPISHWEQVESVWRLPTSAPAKVQNWTFFTISYIPMHSTSLYLTKFNLLSEESPMPRNFVKLTSNNCFILFLLPKPAIQMGWPRSWSENIKKCTWWVNICSWPWEAPAYCRGSRILCMCVGLCPHEGNLREGPNLSALADSEFLQKCKKATAGLKTYPNTHTHTHTVVWQRKRYID